MLDAFVVHSEICVKLIGSALMFGFDVPFPDDFIEETTTIVQRDKAQRTCMPIEHLQVHCFDPLKDPEECVHD